ncbi:hypothetical protein SAMN04488005_0734 [Yoonia tamlensis]|uniref:Uncharacterized protein n=1 Tax=Yoonia tamlensis TaxID=390270 RepID=A0A1I6FYF7_9RHOB|nr:hypothetical protein [Yoonia tamlensis]SFR34944.1 hypothetical protein SAMN04488005_0734 [Yoonia tamlensis]
MICDDKAYFVTFAPKREDPPMLVASEHRFPHVIDVFDELADYAHALLERKPDTN